jgi:hypothetical protein
MVPASGRCRYHPERMGIGVCVECRNVICAECSTQFEGINRCAHCLAQRHAALRKLVERKSWTFGNVLLSLIAIAAVFGTVRLLARLLEG